MILLWHPLAIIILSGIITDAEGNGNVSQIGKNNSNSKEILELFRNSRTLFDATKHKNATLILGPREAKLDSFVNYIFEERNFKFDKKSKDLPYLITNEDTLEIFYVYPQFPPSDSVKTYTLQQYLFHDMLVRAADGKIKILILLPFFDLKHIYAVHIFDVAVHLYNIFGKRINLHYLQNSLAVAVEGVDYNVGAQKYVGRIVIIREVAESFDFANNELKNNAEYHGFEEGSKLLNFTQEFLNIILRRQKQEYLRLTTCAESKYQRDINHEREAILDFISDMEFSNIPYEILTIKDKNMPTQLAEEINTSIKSVTTKIGEGITKKFTIDDRNMDLDKDYETLKNARQLLLELKKENITSIKGFIQKAVVLVKKMNIRNMAPIIRSLLADIQLMDDLEESTGETLVNTSRWMSGFDDVITHLTQQESWCLFQKGLFSDLPALISQGEVNTEPIINNIYAKLLDGNKTVKISELGFEEALNLKPVYRKFKNQNLMQTKLEQVYENVKDMEVDKDLLWSVEKTLSKCNFTTRFRSPKPNTLEIVGLVVKASEVKNRTEGKGFKRIEVFAFSMFIVDTDLDFRGKEITLAIIAKIWILIGNKKINLEGLNAEEYVEEQTSKQATNTTENNAQNTTNETDYKDTNATQSAENGTAETTGKSGAPGKPGLPGGNFFGLAQKVTGEGFLTVHAKGGNGGPGENGTKGADGEDGTFAKSLNFRRFNEVSYGWDYWGNAYFPEEDGVTFYNTTHTKGVYAVWHNFHIHGTDGKPGQNGGDGGASGNAGKAGSVTIIDMSYSRKIIEDESASIDGPKGMGAKGGAGGYHHDGALIYCDFVSITFGEYACELRQEYGSLRNYDPFLVMDDPSYRNKKGASGNNGGNKEGQESPKEPAAYQVYTTINRFKAVVREFLGDSINKRELIEFVRAIDGFPEVVAKYDATALMEELKILEEQFPKLYKAIDFIPFYETLLKRVEDYSNKTDLNNRDTKLALTSLYTAIYSKLCALNNNVNRYMIVDVHYFLSKVLQDIKGIEKLGRELTISNHVDEYNKEIDEEINTAKDIIEKKMLPDLDEIMKDIKQSLEQAENELEIKEKQKEVDKSVAKGKQKAAMEKGMIINCFGKIANVVKGFSALGGMKSTFGSLMSPNNVANNLFNTDTVSQMKKGLQTITKSALEDPSGMLKYLKKDGDFLLEQIDIVTGASKRIKNKDYFGLIQDAFSHARSQVENKFKNNEKIYDSELQELRNKIQKSAEQQLNKLLKIKSTSSAFKIAREFSEYTSAAFSFADDTFKVFAHNMTKTIAMAKTYNEAQKAFPSAMYKKQIDTIAQQINTMELGVKGALNDFSGKTIPEITADKWNIKSKLEDMKETMGKMLKEFTAQKQIQSCFDKLINLVESVAETYDKIDDCNKQKKLAQYNADMSSSRNVWDVSDRKLYNELNKMTFVMKASGLMVQYDRAMDALKQYVFPFAHHFLAEFSSLPAVSLEDDFKNILFTIIPQIEKLYSSLDDWTSSITPHDAYIFRNVYFTQFNEQPFYTFEYSAFNISIKNILKGKEVLIAPDIKTGIDEEAVKFNRIRLTFKLWDGQKQEKFNDALKNYDIEMIHHGNNNYRCGNRYFTIRSEPLTISYSFEKNNEGQPLRRNSVYDKIAKNDYFLSPYAFWTVKLLNAVDTTDHLNSYLNESMDLLLEGVGQYVEMNDEFMKVCDGPLEQYYTEFDKDAELNAILVQVL